MVHNNLNIKLIYFNNSGYHSIRQTQTNLFKGEPLVGVSSDNGISFPDAEKISNAYGIPFYRIDNIDKAAETVKSVIDREGPVFCEVVLDIEQNFEPKLSSKVMPDGTIVSPELDDMFPFLPRDEYEANKKISD